MMKTRLSLALGLLLAVTPASTAAQESSPAPGAVDTELVTQLCAAIADDDAERDACLTSVEAALAEMADVAQEERSLLEQAASIVDETLEDLRQIDVEAAFDELVESARAFELDATIESAQQAIDEAVTDAQQAIEELELPSEVDIQAALDEAVAEALAATEDFDLQAAVDEALAEAQVAIEEADLEGVVDEAVVALESSVEDARAIVAEAQRWAQENRDAVCRGGSVSLGTTVGIAVFVVTGVEWLGLQAFWATERFTNGVCGDIVE
jgi:hypothetical protein